MPALVAGIHVLQQLAHKTWMAGTSPAMTTSGASAIEIYSGANATMQPPQGPPLAVVAT